jgi:hypothetical protein
MQFDGVDDYVDTGSDLAGSGNISISAWIYARSDGENDLGSIIDNRKVIFVYEFKGKLIKEKLDNKYSIVFDTLIPEKDIKYVMAQDRIKSGRKY